MICTQNKQLIYMKFIVMIEKCHSEMGDQPVPVTFHGKRKTWTWSDLRNYHVHCNALKLPPIGFSTVLSIVASLSDQEVLELKDEISRISKSKTRVSLTTEDCYLMFEFVWSEIQSVVFSDIHSKFQKHKGICDRVIEILNTSNDTLVEQIKEKLPKLDAQKRDMQRMKRWRKFFVCNDPNLITTDISLDMKIEILQKLKKLIKGEAVQPFQNLVEVDCMDGDDSKLNRHQDRLNQWNTYKKCYSFGGSTLHIEQELNVRLRTWGVTDYFQIFNTIKDGLKIRKQNEDGIHSIAEKFAEIKGLIEVYPTVLQFLGAFSAATKGSISHNHPDYGLLYTSCMRMLCEEFKVEYSSVQFSV